MILISLKSDFKFDITFLSEIFNLGVKISVTKHL